MTNQSLFANYFFVIKRIEDYGRLDTSRRDKPKSIKIPRTPSQPFYMAQSQEIYKDKSQTKHYINYVNFFLRFGKTLIGGDVHKLTKYRFRLSHFSETVSFRKRYYTAKADLGRSFVYVPLHLQPELTIDVLGGDYGDQARAIEELSVAVPSDWLIYVKENPKQTAVAREEPFFRRLEALPNVRLIRQETDTYDLIRHARCVATWSGTAGWEALLMGKPAIVFGYAWYRRLPGVFEWRHGVDFDALAEAGPDRKTLLSAFRELTRHLRQGVVDPQYAVLVPDFDPQKNGQRVAKALIESVTEKSDSAQHIFDY
jgi:hypothetical protein